MWSLIILLFLFILVVYLYYPNSRCTVLQRIPYRDGVTIEVVEDECSEGLPHTVDSNTIRMPVGAYNNSRKAQTLFHEMVHIAQRRNLQAWYDFYEREWGYTKYTGERRFDIRPNPDTADHPLMLWRNRFIFVPEYGSNRTLRGAQTRVWDTELNKYVNKPQEWIEFFESSGPVHQSEHPHEIAAELLTHRPDCPAFRLLLGFTPFNLGGKEWL